MNGEKNKVRDLIDQGTGQPKIITLNLATALVDQQFDVSGTAFGMWDAPGANDTIQVRFNSNRADQIPFKRGKVLGVLFERVFITVAAGLTGNAEIIYGSGSFDLFRIYPNIAEHALILEQIRDELMGDLVDEGFGQTAVGVAAINVIAANATRKGWSIESDVANAQPIYVGFDNTVAANNHIRRLAPGGYISGDDYRGDIYCEAGGAAQNVNWGEW